MAKDNKVSQQKELNELTLEYEKLKDEGLRERSSHQSPRERDQSLSRGDQ